MIPGFSQGATLAAIAPATLRMRERFGLGIFARDEIATRRRRRAMQSGDGADVTRDRKEGSSDAGGMSEGLFEAMTSSARTATHGADTSARATTTGAAVLGSFGGAVVESRRRCNRA